MFSAPTGRAPLLSYTAGQLTRTVTETGKATGPRDERRSEQRTAAGPVNKKHRPDGILQNTSMTSCRQAARAAGLPQARAKGAWARRPGATLRLSAREPSVRPKSRRPRSNNHTKNGDATNSQTNPKQDVDVWIRATMRENNDGDNNRWSTAAATVHCPSSPHVS